MRSTGYIKELNGWLTYDEWIKFDEAVQTIVRLEKEINHIHRHLEMYGLKTKKIKKGYLLLLGKVDG